MSFNWNRDAFWSSRNLSSIKFLSSHMRCQCKFNNSLIKQSVIIFHSTMLHRDGNNNTRTPTLLERRLLVQSKNDINSHFWCLFMACEFLLSQKEWKHLDTFNDSSCLMNSFYIVSISQDRNFVSEACHGGKSPRSVVLAVLVCMLQRKLYYAKHTKTQN